MDRSARSTGIVVTAVTLGAIGLHLARSVLIPLAVALILFTLLDPLVALLNRRLRLPTVAGAILVVLALLGALAGAGFALAQPAQKLTAEVPASLRQARERMSSAMAGVEPGRAQRPAQPAAGSSSPPAALGGQAVTFALKAFGTGMEVLAGTVEAVLLALFFLAAGDTFRRRLASSLAPSAGVSLVREVERVVGRYVGVTALINLGQAVVVALALWAIGLPNPIAWGALTFIFEFVPYLGATLLLALLFAAGLADGGGVGRALLAPGVYLAISTLQNNLVSPLAYGARLRLNPAAILVGVMIWWAIWGAAGAFLAVPIIASVKVIADRTGALPALSRLLGE